MTRVVAIGIGADVGRSELYNIASYPHELNVIMAPDFSNLTASNVENHVVRALCGNTTSYSLNLRMSTSMHGAPQMGILVPTFAWELGILW